MQIGRCRLQERADSDGQARESKWWRLDGGFTSAKIRQHKLDSRGEIVAVTGQRLDKEG